MAEVVVVGPAVVGMARWSWLAGGVVGPVVVGWTEVVVVVRGTDVVVVVRETEWRECSALPDGRGPRRGRGPVVVVVPGVVELVAVPGVVDELGVVELVVVVPVVVVVLGVVELVVSVSSSWSLLSSSQ